MLLHDQRTCLVLYEDEAQERQKARESGWQAPYFDADELRSMSRLFGSSVINIERVKDALWFAASTLDRAAEPLVIGETVTAVVRHPETGQPSTRSFTFVGFTDSGLDFHEVTHEPVR